MNNGGNIMKNAMDKEIYLSGLYDYYGALLTDKQREYFENYYFNNLSLAEIAENYNTSRNAIHKQIKDTENKLLYYEEIFTYSISIVHCDLSICTDLSRRD